MRICASLHSQIADIRKLSKPQNVAALVFAEEIPGAWGMWHFLTAGAYKAGELDAPGVATQHNRRDTFPAFLKPYQKPIEQNAASHWFGTKKPAYTSVSC